MVGNKALALLDTLVLNLWRLVYAASIISFVH